MQEEEERKSWRDDLETTTKVPIVSDMHAAKTCGEFRDASEEEGRHVGTSHRLLAIVAAFLHLSQNDSDG